MVDRLALQTLLESQLGSTNVYFQPPTNLEMKFPAIVYFKSKVDSRFAGDATYAVNAKYMVTYIDKDPDSLVPNKLLKLKHCTHDRRFIKDGRNHDVFTLYF